MLAGLHAVVEDDGGAEGGEVLGGAEADLVLGLAVREGLAIAGVLLRDLVGSAEAEHQRTDAARAGDLDRLDVRARHVQRRVRVLPRLGVDRATRDVDELAVVLDLVLHQDLRDEVHRLVDLLRQIVQVVAECAGLLLRAALAHAEVHAALREDVERRDALGDLHRVVHCGRQADHAVTDADALGLSGDEGQHGLGRRGVRVIGERGVLDAPEHVEVLAVAGERELHRFLEYAAPRRRGSCRWSGSRRSSKISCARPFCWRLFMGKGAFILESGPGAVLANRVGAPQGA